MSLLLYAIAEAEVAVAGTGLEDRPLHSVKAGPLAAIVSTHDTPRPQPTIDTLCQYEEAVERLMSSNAILPARFASVVEDEEEARTMLSRRRRDLVSALDRVRGAVELAVSAGWRGAPQPAAAARRGPGTAYLETRLGQRARAKQVAVALEPLAGVARVSRCRLNPRAEAVLQAAYLVDRTRIDDFVGLVEVLDGRLAEVELACTGPWPPYSFVEGAPA